MATTQEDVDGWVKRAIEKKAAHLVVCDCFDCDDYPVFILSGDDYQETKDKRQIQ